MDALSLFLFGCIALLAAPGPTNALLATAGALSGGRQVAALLATGLAGYLVAILVLRVAAAPLLEALPGAGLVLKGLIALYLVWMAFRLWRSTRALDKSGEAVRLRDMLVTTLLNPKALILAFSIFPQGKDWVWPYLLLFALIMPAIGLGWALLGRLAGRAAGRSGDSLIRRIASLVLLGFAGLLAASALN